MFALGPGPIISESAHCTTVVLYCRRARRGRPSGVRLYSLVGDVDSPVARVGAVADRQEVDLVSAAAAPEPRYLKNKNKHSI